VGRWKRLLPWAAGTASLLYALACFVPWRPPKTYGAIEDSWILSLHLAFRDHLQFGSDLVFSMGPWGFLYGGYHPATHLVAVITWSALAVVFWLAAWDASRQLFGDGPVAWLWLIALIAATETTIWLNIDVRLTAFVLIFLVRQFFVERPAFKSLDAALVVVLGLLSLIKFSLLIYVAVVVAVVGLAAPVPLYLASLLVFWVLAGQRLSSIGPFVRNSLRVAAGYTESMMISGLTDLRDIALFSAAAGLLAVLGGIAAWRRHGPLGGLFLAGWSFSLFTAFKYGYVRHDGHEAVAVLTLLLMSFFSVAMLWPQARVRGWGATLSTLLAPAAIGALALFTYSRYAHPDWTPREHGTLREAYEAFLARVRNETPLPPMTGTTDAYPWNKALVLACGLPLRSRPVIQSYCAFSPELAELNAAFLRGGHGAENIVFQLNTVDDRYPSLDDGRSWPELLTQYDLRDAEDSFLLLTRSSSPREFHLTPIRELSLAFRERLDLPATNDGPIWAEIEIPRTLRGSIMAALYKPPELWFHIKLRDGRVMVKRLIPGMTKGGFLLSPFVGDNASFAALAASPWPGDLAETEVAALSVTAPDGSAPSAYYGNPISVRLYHLDYPRQDGDRITGYQRLAHFRRALHGSTTLRGDPPRMAYAPDAGTRLIVPRDSASMLHLPPGARRLRLSFGVSGTPPRGGIVFQLSSVDLYGRPTPLWSQSANAEGTQEATVDLSKAGLAALVLETFPAEHGTTDTGSAFWSELDFESN
jgi:hypothetical protein